MEQIKKYIRGNSERGHEVIAELKKLGGKNTLKLKGNEYDKVYYIARCGYAEPNTIDIVSEKSFIGQLIVTHPEWEEIKLPEQFKDGDVVAATITSGIWIGIFKQYKAMFFESYCSLSTAGEFHSRGFENHQPIGLRLATEEEKEKLFQAIKERGYRWNAEKKELEKIEPKFKVGDRVLWNYNTEIPRTISKVELASKGSYVYWIDCKGCSSGWWSETELTPIPNKFDISTLVPFESRVLVRDCKSEKWCPAIWGLKTDDINYPYVVVGGGGYNFCIPFEGNKHLLGTTNDCPDFYKTWEE